MSNFDDFDNDTPPQGGPEDDHDAELVMHAERQAEEDQMLAELAREESEDQEAEQRRLDALRRDDDQRDADDRRDAIQSDLDRQEDFARAEQDRIARQAELDAEMEFSMGPEKAEEEPSESEKAMQDVRERHAADVQGHHEKQAALEAEAALREQAQPSHYKGGFVDLKGNNVSAQDVNAIMANHQASGGHQAAQERFGLATGKGSELAAAHYKAQELGQDTAPTAAEQLGALRDGQQLSNAQLLEKSDLDRTATAERQAEVSRIEQMGTAANRQEALHTGSTVVLSEREQAVLDHLDRMEAQGDMGDGQAAQTEDWAAYMGVSDAHAKEVADIIRTEEIKAKAEAHFLPRGAEASENASTLEPLTEREEAVLNHVDRQSGPDAIPAEQTEDWGTELSEEELQAQRERQAQSQGMELSR